MNKKDLCHPADEYKRPFVSGQRRTLVLGWRCAQIKPGQARSSSNSQRRAQIYHLADVGAVFFPPQVQVFQDAVYKCDNDGKQLVQESFPVTSTCFHRNL